MRSKGKHVPKHSAKMSLGETAKIYNIEIIEAVLMLAIVGKLTLFYKFMGVSHHFVPVLLISCFFVHIIFLLRRKFQWLPLILFGIITFVMFADAVFCGYFGRYLTVGMAGNAEVLGDIGDCIKQAMKPYFFLLFVDFIGLLIFEIYLKKTKQEPRHIAKIPDPKHILLVGKIVVAIILCVVLIVNPLSWSLCQSISHAEFFTFHLKDFAGIDDSLDTSNLEYENNASYYADHNDPIFGIGEDRNLIVVQLESFMNFAIGARYQGQEITPNINKLIKDEDTIYFDNYYQQVGAGNTSDAEFATNNSFMGSSYSYTYALYYENYFKGLPWLLKEKGYSTAVYHAYTKTFWNRDKAYPNLGFDKFVSKNDFKSGDNIGWGLGDVDFFKQSVNMIKKEKGLSYSMLISLSGHYPYNMGKDHKIFKEDDKINSAFARYLDAVHYTDEAVGALMKELEKTGLDKKSVIALYGDHQGFATENADYSDSFDNFLGRKADMDDQMGVPLIISIPGASKELGDETLNRTISISGGQTDFMPTICYILGFEELDTFYMGQNLLKAKSGFVAEKYYAATGSFIMDDVVFVMSNDYVFENSRAYNRITREKIAIDQYYNTVLKAGTIITEANRILIDDDLRFTIGGENQGEYKIPKRVKLNMDGTIYVPGQENQNTDPNLTPVENITGNAIGGAANSEDTSGAAIESPEGNMPDVEDWLDSNEEAAAPGFQEAGGGGDENLATPADGENLTDWLH